MEQLDTNEDCDFDETNGSEDHFLNIHDFFFWEQSFEKNFHKLNRK